MPLRLLGTVLIGLGSGVLSGMFGIGGGIVTTPAIRVLLDAPALVAVGTPLAAIIPSAVTGALSYARNGLSDVRAGVFIGLTGSVTAILGAWLTRLVGGRVVLIVTAVLILYIALDMVLQAFRISRSGTRPTGAADGAGIDLSRTPAASLLVLGSVTGLYSGFLGLGGGLVLVPLLTRWLRFDIKRAIGTSLVAVALLAVPGTITHALLGNVDWFIAAGLIVGVVPGAAIGSRITLGASERSVRLGFAVLLVVVGLWLGVNELAGWAA